MIIMIRGLVVKVAFTNFFQGIGHISNRSHLAYASQIKKQSFHVKAPLNDRWSIVLHLKQTDLVNIIIKIVSSLN